MAGYSGTPLHKKLGTTPGCRFKTRGAPANYRALIEPIPSDVTISSRLRNDIDIFHVFTKSRAELDQQLAIGMEQIKRDGMIWVSWPKKASKVPCDFTEDTIRDLALPMGLVDVKVCAVDEVWSGLKLVIRKERR